MTSAVLLIALVLQGELRVVAAYPVDRGASCEYVAAHQAVRQSWREIFPDKTVVFLCRETARREEAEK